MKNSVGYVYGNARDPATQVEIELRLGFRWPPTLYLYASTYSDYKPYDKKPRIHGLVLVFGILVIGIKWGKWRTQP